MLMHQPAKAQRPKA